jgi:hypothetical protein
MSVCSRVPAGGPATDEKKDAVRLQHERIFPRKLFCSTSHLNEGLREHAWIGALFFLALAQDSPPSGSDPPPK